MSLPSLEFAGIRFANPFVVASSPLTARLDLLQQAERAGAAAASLKLTFTRQPFYGQLRMYSDPRLASIVCYDKRLDAEEGVELARQAKKATSLILFANITHPGEDMAGWADLARAFARAGVDLIEANLVCPNVSLTAKRLGVKTATVGASVGQVPELCFEVVRTLKSAVDIPVVAKLTPNVTDITQTARACAEAGADGITLAGAQLAAPPVDIYRQGRPAYPMLQGASLGSLGGPAARLLSYAAIAQIARAVSIPIVGGGGLQNWQHAVECIMWGATLVTACTELMWRGFQVIPKILQGMETYMQQQSYATYEAMRGLALSHLMPAAQLVAVEAAATLEPAKCNGCGRCLLPGHCTAINWHPTARLPIIDVSACLGCAICVSVCPRHALTMQPTEPEQ